MSAALREKITQQIVTALENPNTTGSARSSPPSPTSVPRSTATDSA